jgi:hypothetical protein
MTQSHTLPHDLISKTLNYLATRPWIEVNQLIIEISNHIKKAKETEVRDGDSTKPGES